MDENYLKLAILKLQTTQPVLEVVKPLRLRQKQNIIISTEYPEMYDKPNIRFIQHVRYCYTTIETKIIILKK